MSIRTGISKTSGEKVKICEIDPEDDYKCEMCDGNLVAKRGRLVIYHFAHEHLVDCDQWRENKSKWHILWQDICKKDFVEVPYKNLHQADIVNIEGMVIEIQNSPMSIDTMEEREDFYGRMIWVVNATSMNDRHSARKLTIITDGSWAIIKVLHKFWLHSKKNVFVHTDFGLYRIRKTVNKWYCIAERIDVQWFLERNFRGILKDPSGAAQALACSGLRSPNDVTINFEEEEMYVRGKISDADKAMLRGLGFRKCRHPNSNWVLKAKRPAHRMDRFSFSTPLCFFKNL